MDKPNVSQNVIKQLLNADMAARKEIDAKKALKSKIEKQIAQDQQKKYQEELAGALQEVERLNRDYEEAYGTMLEKQQDDFSKQVALLDDKVSRNKEKWVDLIVARVQKG